MNALPLSVCLITRDEAHNLPGLMQSVRGLAREVVVVDTGSSDGTPELARALGARVLHASWQDDFSAARNVALEAARSEWLLTLDADQQLDAGSHAALARAVLRRDCLAQLVTIRLLGPPEPDGREHVVQHLPSLRLVRRDSRIRYRGRVHEDVSESLQTIGSVDWPDSGVTVTDHGYVDAGARQRKLARNLELLRLSFQERPEALYLAYKLAISLPREAREERDLVLAKALGHALGWSSKPLRELACLPRLTALALQSWTQSGRLEEAADAAQALWQRAGGTLAFTAGCALARAGRFAPAREGLLAYLRQIPAPARLGEQVASGSPPSLALADEQAHPAEACWWLAWMALTEGDPVQAGGWIDQGMRHAGPGPHAGLAVLSLELTLSSGDVGAAAQALEALGAKLAEVPGSLNNSMAELMLASARLALASGDESAARAFAAQAVGARDDTAAVFLAQLDVAAGQTDPALLRSHHDAILGQRFDTLAVKLTLGGHLGLAWPHPVPAATRALLAG